MEFFLRQIYPWLVEVSVYSSLLPFTVGLFLMKKWKNLLFRLLFLFVTLGVVSEGLGVLTVFMGTKNNLWLHHVTTPLEFAALAALFYHSFNKVLFKKIILVAVVGLVVYSIINAFMLEGYLQINSGPRMATNSLLILLSIAYFYQVANDRTTIYLDRDPMFLLSCAVLIYYAGTSMAFALFNQALAVSYDTARICLSVWLILNVLFNAGQALVLRRMAV